MPSIADAMTPAAFAKLDALCLAKLERVDLGGDRDAERMLASLRAIAEQATLCWRDRAALYQACYRFRTQIGDTPFVARVLIAKAEADPLVRREGGRAKIRAWSADNPFAAGAVR